MVLPLVETQHNRKDRSQGRSGSGLNVLPIYQLQESGTSELAEWTGLPRTIYEYHASVEN
jgi:hypothetical protein